MVVAGSLPDGRLSGSYSEMGSEKFSNPAKSGYNKGTIRSDIRYLVVSKDVRRHRLISISYISHGRCHGRGRGFESRRPRHSFQALLKNRRLALGSKRVQLDRCRSSLKYLVHNSALRQTLLGHTSLCIQIESNAAVGMAKKFLHDFDVFAVLREQCR